MSILELKHLTEEYLTEFFPERYIPGNIVTTRDIYDNRSLLKRIKFNNYILGYLSDIILADIDNGRRFRKYECLKVIKSIVKAKESKESISQDAISKLFRIYKELIFTENEELKWCLSAIIKDQILSEEDIGWLTNNYEESDHLVNRLLRYPEKNRQVTAWGKQVYKNNKLQDRISEVIGLLIDEDIPPYVSERGSELIWAIYYAQCTDMIKQELLKKYYSQETLETVLIVSSRLNFPEVMEFILESLNRVVNIA